MHQRVVLWVAAVTVLARCAPGDVGAGLGSAQAAAGATQFFDDFNRTTGLGPAWTVAFGSFATDGAVARATASQSYAAWAGTPTPDATVSIALSNPAGTYAGVLVRANATNAASDHYAGYVDPAGHVAIARRDAWTYTYLATGGPLFPSGTHVLSLTASGAGAVMLSLAIDGATVLTAVDSSAKARASGSAGVFDYSGAGVALDNFTVTAPGSTSDAGTPDAGTPDAGSPDAGTPDAGTPGSSVLFQDGFNRTGALGSNWTVAGGAFSANGAAATGTAPSSYAFWTGLPDRDSSVSVDFTTPIGNTYIGVLLRAPPSNPAADHYAAYIGPDSVLGIARRDAWNYSYLATGPYVPPGRHTLTFSAVGASPVTLSVQLDGLQVMRVTDTSALTTAGLAGMNDYEGLGVPLDNFTVYGAGGAPPPDGGTPDGGTPDAGTPDAGTPDAGTPDAGTPPPGTNPIAQENALPGSDGWNITSYTSLSDLAGYFSTDSAIAGDTVTGFVHSSVSGTITWRLYRIGWYGGLGGRLISQGQFNGSSQPSCPVDSSTGLVECAWSPSFSFTVDPSWVSGVYVGTLTRSADGKQTMMMLTIRDTRAAAIVIQQSVTTWQAYNDYGGESLYVSQIPLPQGHAVKVSFARPYANSYAEFDDYEEDFVRWIESQGFDATYVTNLDFIRNPNQALRAHVFLSVGHDEYWSAQERDALEQARAAGVSQGYFSANSAYWQIRVESDANGQPRRLVCYKDKSDPLAGTPQATLLWRDPALNRPENGLLGAMSVAWDPIAVPFAVDDPTHWLFAGTGLAEGDTIGQIVGYEVDARWNNGFTPSGTVRLAGHPVVDVFGKPADHELTLYTAPSGAIVLDVGMIEWGGGLYNPGVADARLQRITTNFLEATGAYPATPRALPQNGNAWSRADTTGASSSVTTIAGVPGNRGSSDGPAAQATFNRPGGIAVGSDGTIYVSDAAASRIRMIRNGTVSTLAGSAPGYADGTGSQAQFNGPQALAMAQDGSLLVADTGNNCIRRVTTSGVVSTYAGVCGWIGYADGSAGSALFNCPQGIAVGPSGTVYVADTYNDAIRKIASGNVSTLASSPNQDHSVLYFPTGLAIGSDGTAYVVDSGHEAIRRVTTSGNVSSILSGVPPSPPYRLTAGFPGGFADGPLTGALAFPGYGIALVGSTLYFSDAGNDRIRKIDLTASTVTTFAGTGRARCEDGGGAQAAFEYPQQIAATPGALFVADSCSAIRRVSVP